MACSKMRRCSILDMFHTLFIHIFYNIAITRSVQDIFALVRWSLSGRYFNSKDKEGEMKGEIIKRKNGIKKKCKFTRLND